MKKAAEIIDRRKGEIMKVWAKDVRQMMEGANLASDLVLMDHLPNLLEDIVEIMEANDSFNYVQKNDFQQLFKNSVGHGRHRSASYGYTIEQVIKEYISLHKVLTEVLISEDAYDTEVSQLLKYTIENIILFSASAFNQSISEMRQKLIRILAHDLRNPISAAYLAVDVLDGDMGKERLERIREMTKSSLRRALDLVESLLETISIEAGEGMTVNFSEDNLMKYIESLHYEASEIYSNEIKLEVKGDREIKGIFDGSMIRRVLENFLNNALKYGSRNSPILIAVENSEDFVSIKVHNKGNPIPEEKKKMIFQFLNTSGQKRNGELRSWGIGLALVKAVVQAHGGELEVDSNEDEGTSFGIKLEKYKNEPGQIKVALNFK